MEAISPPHPHFHTSKLPPLFLQSRISTQELVVELRRPVFEGQLVAVDEEVLHVGDPFQPATDVEHLFIDGYKLPLENRATKLYDEFLNRNPGLEK